MLQNIREHITGWVAGIVIVLIAIAFVFWGLEYYLNQSTTGGATVAKVNGHEISEKAFNQVFQNLQRQQIEKSGGAPLNENTRKALKQYALQQMITQAALSNAINDAGLSVSDDQIKQVIVSDPEFQVNGKFSPQKFQQLLYANALSPEQFFNRMRQMLMMNQLSSGLQNSAFVLPKEVKQAFLLLKEDRNFGYFLVPSKSFMSSVTVNEKDIKNYYQQNLESFKEPEKVKASYLVLSPEEISKTIKVSDEDIKQYYQTNKANYTTPKRWKISQILIPVNQNASKQAVNEAKEAIQQVVSKIDKGTTFSTLMKNGIKNQKTSTYWINQAQLSGSMVGILNNLKVNQVSSPFRTEQGFLIIKLDEIQSPQTKTLSDVKNEIRKLLVHQKAQQIFSKKSDQLSNLTYTNPNTLSIAAKALDLKMQTSDLITRQGAKSGILSNPKILAVLFSDDVLQQRNNSQPIELKDGSLVVVRVDQRIPSKEKNLSSVKDKIKTLLMQQKAERQAGLKAYQIQTALNKDESPDAVAKKFNVQWSEKTDIDRNDKSINQDILTKAFNLSLNKDADIASIQLDNGDYAVIKLLKITTPDFSEVTSSEKDILKANLANFYGQMDYRAFINSVVKAAKIKIYKNKE